MNSLALKFDYIEDRSRNNNLIARGVKEEDYETEQTLLNTVNEIHFQDILGAKAN